MLGQGHLIVGFMDAPMTLSAYVNALIQRITIVVFFVADTAMNFARYQMVEREGDPASTAGAVFG